MIMWLEETWLATFVRESPSLFAFPGVLFLHTIGLSLAVGLSTIVAIRVLGMASSIPLQPLGRLSLPTWIGFGLATFSGVALAIADASNKLLNPIVLVKLTFVVLAGISLWFMQKKVFLGAQGSDGAAPAAGRAPAAAMLVFWVGAMIGGRLIAYWRTILDA